MVIDAEFDREDHSSIPEIAIEMSLKLELTSKPDSTDGEKKKTHHKHNNNKKKQYVFLSQNTQILKDRHKTGLALASMK
jgi:hypothetical protein